MTSNRRPAAALLAALMFLALPAAAGPRADADLEPEISPREAQQQAFGKHAGFRELKREEVEQRAKAASRQYNEYINAFRMKIWEVRVDGAPAGWFVTDAVIGKVEKIDYAVALDTDGKVRRVFINKYRESHGQEVKRPDWLAQFNGKGVADTLKLKKDIDNITGATLSCDHLTDGIRRINRMLAPPAKPAP